jgi:hypothetical protein
LRRIEATADPPPKRLEPLIVTTVPTCPLEGDTEVIVPFATNVHEPLVVTTVEPVLEITVTLRLLPTLDGATAYTALLVALTILRAGTVPNNTCETLMPPPRRLFPTIPTIVPARPLLGVTAFMTPGTRYVQAELLVVMVAYDESVIVTATAPAVPGPAMATIDVSDPDTTEAREDPSIMLKTEPLPDRRPVPEMVKIVPA